MSVTPSHLGPGPVPDSREASTHGGPGWLPRTAAHTSELGPGLPWAACGYRSEVAPLREVLLARPPETFRTIEDPRESLMTGLVDLGRMRAQTDALVDAYRRAGVTVHLLAPGPACSPNIVFLRDLFFASPSGVVIGRTASVQRAGEECHVAAALAGLHVPILRTMAGSSTFEGADALWLDRRTVILGVGFRTNAEGAAALTATLREQSVTVLEVPIGSGVQHLLGMVAFLDERLVAVHAAATGPRLRRLLAERDYRVIDIPPTQDLLVARGMNLVTLRPGAVLMPAGAPSIRRTLETAGVQVEELDVSEYVSAAGGIGCLSGVLRRDG